MEVLPGTSSKLWSPLHLAAWKRKKYQYFPLGKNEQGDPAWPQWKKRDPGPQISTISYCICKIDSRKSSNFPKTGELPNCRVRHVVRGKCMWLSSSKLLRSKTSKGKFKMQVDLLDSKERGNHSEGGHPSSAYGQTVQIYPNNKGKFWQATTLQPLQDYKDSSPIPQFHKWRNPETDLWPSLPPSAAKNSLVLCEKLNVSCLARRRK